MTNVIAITSAKPSLGKTFVASSIAFALAYIRNKVLFFDADLGADNINEQLNLNLSDEIPMVLTNQKTLNQIVVENKKPFFDIISSAGGIIKLKEVPQGRANILFEDLAIISNDYDNLIIDIPQKTSVYYKFDRLVVLCNDEPSSVVNCFDIIKNNIEKDVEIIINFANSYVDGKRVFDNIYKACYQNLGIKPKLLGIIRKDSRVKDAIRNKVSIINRYPNSDASIDIFNIAKKIKSYEARSEE